MQVKGGGRRMQGGRGNRGGDMVQRFTRKASNDTESLICVLAGPPAPSSATGPVFLSHKVFCTRNSPKSLFIVLVLSLANLQRPSSPWIHHLRASDLPPSSVIFSSGSPLMYKNPSIRHVHQWQEQDRPYMAVDEQKARWPTSEWRITEGQTSAVQPD